MSVPYFRQMLWNSLTPLSLAKIGVAGSFPKTMEIEPFAAFCGTAIISAEADETSLTKTWGCQLTRLRPLYACSENFPNAKMQSTFAFDALSCAICGCTSVVVGS